ncbi:MAG TPA: RNA polymerase sigma factor, partial [Salinimicrobium sp.]|nr:RNA polymerase sigma factor [Salinimicrobium sp.]
HQYKGEVSFGAWLKKIVVNKCIDILKVRKLELIALNENILIPVEEEQNWEISEGFSIEDCKKEIEGLPAKYKYPLMLYLMEGYDHQEIAEILNISEVASRTLVHRGKKKLQEQLKSKNYGTGY